jgi:hypothetical protein
MKQITMTPIMLVDILVKFLKPVVMEFELETNVHGIKKAPEVVKGYLPAKKPTTKQETPDFPYVIVRYLEDTDQADGGMAVLKIYVGTYSDDEQQGWQDAMNVITKIKIALLKRRNFGPFRIEYPIKTELPEEQPYPEWAAILTLNILIPHIIEEGGIEYELT